MFTEHRSGKTIISTSESFTQCSDGNYWDKMFSPTRSATVFSQMLTPGRRCSSSTMCRTSWWGLYNGWLLVVKMWSSPPDDGGGEDVMSHHHHHMTPTPTSWTMWSASATPPTHFCPTTRLWRWTTIDASNFCPKTVNQHNHENVCKHHHHQSSSPSSSSISIIIVIKILLQRFSAAPSLSPPGMCRSLSSSLSLSSSSFS